MLGKNNEPSGKGQDSAKRFPPKPFGTKQPIVNQPGAQSNKDGKPGVDNFQRTNKAERGTGPLLSGSNMDLSEKTMQNRDFTETALDDGVTIIRYKEPQRIDNLIKDAKMRVGGETSKFFSKGWVIGKELAKISPDGLSITYYPEEVADLVQELIGYTNTNEENL